MTAAQDRATLRQSLRDKIDEVSQPGGWSGKKRKPCMSAVMDRTTGDIYYNHNVKDAVDPDDLDPLLRERYDKWLNKDNGSGWRQLEENQSMHGVPGQHSEVRALNEALKNARSQGREPKLSDFMVENAKVTRDDLPSHKVPMPCCANCAQMVDGTDGAWGGWTEPFGTKLEMWDRS
ncbi:YwqJ-related putative deaminase [Glycomyces sp. NPDC046736]|uniref:YwqJ-related putative deaminase n=1 Tax=Glycomyces sp. NPDC046736 TaxID=3155615 RepID=UPI0033D13B17